jgi:hypothetical protein
MLLGVPLTGLTPFPSLAITFYTFTICIKTIWIIFFWPCAVALMTTVTTPFSFRFLPAEKPFYPFIN